MDFGNEFEDGLNTSSIIGKLPIFSRWIEGTNLTQSSQTIIGFNSLFKINFLWLKIYLHVWLFCDIMASKLNYKILQIFTLSTHFWGFCCGSCLYNHVV